MLVRFHHPTHHSPPATLPPFSKPLHSTPPHHIPIQQLPPPHPTPPHPTPPHTTPHHTTPPTPPTPPTPTRPYPSAMATLRLEDVSVEASGAGRLVPPSPPLLQHVLLAELHRLRGVPLNGAVGVSFLQGPTPQQKERKESLKIKAEPAPTARRCSLRICEFPHLKKCRAW